MGLGQPVGSTVGNAQQHGDQQQRGDHEERLVPTPLMCEDHPDDRTVWGTSRERRPFYSKESVKPAIRDTNQESREHPCPR